MEGLLNAAAGSRTANLPKEGLGVDMNAAKTQANQLWEFLDELAERDPEVGRFTADAASDRAMAAFAVHVTRCARALTWPIGGLPAQAYKRFVSKQAAEAKASAQPQIVPEPAFCVSVSRQGPAGTGARGSGAAAKGRKLYVNICAHKAVRGGRRRHAPRCRPAAAPLSVCAGRRGPRSLLGPQVEKPLNRGGQPVEESSHDTSGLSIPLVVTPLRRIERSGGARRAGRRGRSPAVTPRTHTHTANPRPWQEAHPTMRSM